MPSLLTPQQPSYYERIESALAGRDPLVVLESTAMHVIDLAARHPGAILRRRPFPGKWTPNEVLGHLVDAELVFGARLRLALAEDEPILPGWDQERWVVALRHNEEQPAGHARRFNMLRSLNLPLWQDLTPAQRARGGRHEKRGWESVALMLRLAAGHDLLHLDQLRRYVEAAERTGI